MIRVTICNDTDWIYSFADRDLMIRHHGSGIGHLQDAYCVQVDHEQNDMAQEDLGAAEDGTRPSGESNVMSLLNLTVSRKLIMILVLARRGVTTLKTKGQTAMRLPDAIVLYSNTNCLSSLFSRFFLLTQPFDRRYQLLKCPSLTHFLL
jgi:hypothetical protein